MKTLVGILLLISSNNLMGQSMEILRENIRDTLKTVDGRFALAVEDLRSGKTLLINEREMFHAASTMKTPVMIELFRQSEAGTFHLEDSTSVVNEFRSIVDGSPYTMDIAEDSDESLYEAIGSKMTIGELIVHMITTSSNLATNILIDLVGAKNVTATMRSFGADSIRVLRGVEDLKAYDQGLNNMTTAYDLLVVFRKIADGTAASAVSCKTMIEILDDQKFRDIIPSLLPQGTRVAHKTGSITGVQHDSGLVFLPNGNRYVIVLLSKDLKENAEGKRVLSRVSRMVYDYFIASGS